NLPKEQLTNFLKHPNILTITGVRRSGKSVLSVQLLKEKKHGYINFDDERLINIESKDLNNVLQAFYELYGPDVEYFVLDEIQNIKDWELFANRLRRTKKIVLTGSNSKLLSGELATHLTGRHIDFTLYPFSFKEYLTFNNIKPTKEDFYSTKKIVEIKKHLKNYIKLGGYPEVYKFGRSMLVRTYEDIIQKDILLRYNIKNKKTFRDLAKYLISNFSNEITYRKLKDVVSIKNDHTIKNYVDYLSTSYLTFILERFSFKLKKQIIAPKKIYCTDTGMINSIAFRFSENSGKMLENLVAIELLRRKSYWQTNLELYYWKDHQQREVDFVLKNGPKIEKLIQVNYASGKDEIDKRETESLVRASKALKCKNLFLITFDYDDEITIDDIEIKCMPIWKWLLE
ncbi:MAG: ATP-binding protein, partial [Candidatus Thermoplasmatota archaeon]|nr:ATP-binding protein [Candidatus Thermoplasmatota archaeon]